MRRRIKELFLSRPLALSLFAFLILLFLFLYLSLPLPLLWASALFLGGALTVAILLGKGKRDSRMSVIPVTLLTLALVAASLLAFGVQKKESALNEAYDGKTFRATFTVNDITYYDNSFWANGYFTEIDGKSCRIKAKMTSYLPTEEGDPLAIADRVSADFSFASTRGEALGELQSLADGYYLTATAESMPVILESNCHTLASRLALFRLRIGKFLEEKLPENAEAAFAALLLADKSKIPFSVTQGFDALGISHLLAVSGLHLTVTVGMFAFLLEKSRLRRAVTYPILAAITLFYITLTGFAPSMLRAGGMLLLFYLSFFAHRTKDAITSLFASVTVIVLLSPTSILDLGLLLSFSATLGILLIAQPANEAIGEKPFFQTKKLSVTALRKLLSAAVITLAASTTILPILLLTKGSIFAFAVLSNLIFSPLFSLLLWTMPLFLATSLIPYLSTAVIFLIEKLATLIFRLAEYGIGFEDLQISLSYAFMPVLVLLMIGSLVILLLQKKRIATLAPILAFFLVAGVGIGISNAALKNDEAVSFTFDGKNDAITVSYADMGLMIDFSQSAQFTKEAFLTVNPHDPAIENRALMLSSVRACHLAAVEELAPYGKLTHLILPEDSAMTETLADLAERLGITVILYGADEQILFEGIAVTPYRSGDSLSLSAVDITLSHKSVLYVKENAPTQLDIRFGPLAIHHDIILYGGFGATPQYTPFDLDADIVVEGNSNQNLRHKLGITYLDTPSHFTDERDP